MSADLIHRAVKLMRERAGVATPGPWSYSGRGWIKPSGPIEVDEADWGPEGHERFRVITNEGPGAWSNADCEHIASWHPAVALAVADWLDAEARLGGPLDADCSPAALVVARAYLGEQS